METRPQPRWRRVSVGTLALILVLIGIAALLVYRDAVIGSLQRWVAQPPQAVIEAQPAQGAAPLTVQFSAAKSSDPDDKIVSYYWDFGDGPGSFQKISSHIYRSPGEYTVTLLVADELGLSHHTTQKITVTQPPPPARTEKKEEQKPEQVAPPVQVRAPVWTVTPTEPYAGQRAEFSVTNLKDYPDRTQLRFTWDFDGDGVTDFIAAQPSHTFSTPGSYTVTLQLLQDDKIVHEVSQVVVVKVNNPPEARFNFGPFNQTAGKPVIFDASQSYDMEGTVIAYQWDFNGDGAADAAGEQVSHAFESPGTYTVSLKVTDNLGSESITSAEVTVAGMSEPDVILVVIGFIAVVILAYLIASLLR